MKFASTDDRRMLLFLPSAFTASVGIGMSSLGMLFDLRARFGLAPATAGWLGAAWSIAYLAGCFLLRPVSRKLPPRISMTIANAVAAVLLALYIVFPSILAAFVAMSVYGFAIALFWPPLMGWLSSGLEGNPLSKANSRFSMSWSVGGILSPYLAGLLAERASWIPIAAASGFFALNTVFIATGRRFAADPSVEPSRSPQPEVAALDRSTVLRYPAWIGLFLVYVLSAIFANIFPLYAKNDMNLGEAQIGFLLLIRAAATAAGFWFFGRNGSWHFKRQLIVAPIAATLVVNLLFLIVRGSVPFAVLLACLGLLQSWAYTNSMFYGASGALDREKRMNTHESLLTFGQFIGSVGGGMAYQYSSWSTVFLFAGVLLVAGLAGQTILVRKAAPGR